MKLDEALEQLDAISAVADRAGRFDGLRSFPTALTAVVGMAGAALQPILMQNSTSPLTTYLLLWVSVAVIALTVVVAGMAIRYFRDPTARARRMTLEVLGRLTPSIVVGGAITVIVFVSANEVAWMLPGIWSVLLGLGIFAASSLIPRSLQPVGVWYIACGLAALILANGENEFSPWAMAIPFAGGQCFAAWLMHRVASQNRRTGGAN